MSAGPRPRVLVTGIGAVGAPGRHPDGTMVPAGIVAESGIVMPPGAGTRNRRKSLRDIAQIEQENRKRGKQETDDAGRGHGTFVAGNGRRRTEVGTTTDGRHGGDGERLLRRPPAADQELEEGLR